MQSTVTQTARNKREVGNSELAVERTMVKKDAINDRYNAILKRWNAFLQSCGLIFLELNFIPLTFD